MASTLPDVAVSGEVDPSGLLIGRRYDWKDCGSRTIRGGGEGSTRGLAIVVRTARLMGRS